MNGEKKTPWPARPFTGIWRLFAAIVEFTGRLLAVIIGLVLIIVGVVISLTVIGALVGVPILFVGLLLTIRGIFQQSSLSTNRTGSK